MLFKAATVLAVAAQLGALFASATPIAEPAVVVALGKREAGYVGSCDKATLVLDQFATGGTAIIKGTCYTATGQKRNSRLNLNHCLGNVQGFFKYVKDGNFSGSCNGFTAYLTQATSSGQNYCSACYLSNGGTNSINCIDLNAVVGNVDGKLQCFGYSDGADAPF
ncbi:CVNH domain-containing protein [Microdochium nivale]|nr:CVNH domain-containing protein [Microdochium nivale]